MEQSKPGIHAWMRKIPRTYYDDEETAAVYNECATEYEKHVPAESKPDPGIIARELEAIYKDQKSIRILDLAAGTGYVGCELNQLGFTNIDALDGSARMLEIAKTKTCYKHCICTFFTKDPTPGLLGDSYDALVSTGSFTPGHLQVNCFVECLRIVKPGGHIILGIYNWLDLFEGDYEKRLHEVIQTHVNSKLCEIVKMQRYEKYNYAGLPGLVFIVRKI